LVTQGTGRRKTLGFLVNPISGMGGAVGLKGTDGKDVLRKAVTLGATPLAPKRAEAFLTVLAPHRSKIDLIVGAGRMGEDEAQKCGFQFRRIGARREETTAEDTRAMAAELRDRQTTLLVFCGGDGTARDILDTVDMRLPVLGVPTGVKMHSAVFATTPRAAARLATQFLFATLPLRETEIMDVDEAAFREGRVSARLYGYTLTPYEPLLIQGNKLASPTTELELRNQAAIALYVIDEMVDDVVYIIGPGTTTRTIGDLLDQRKTLLGVDLYDGKKIIARDVNSRRILEVIRGRKARIIVTPIGGQGYIFGRGNQQISPEVIRHVGREGITVIASKQKLMSLNTLRVDTGEGSLDEELRGYIRVVTDYREESVVPVE
jgi:predicted polyphosphate/ATP-dependent NAD kinase